MKCAVSFLSVVVLVVAVGAAAVYIFWMMEECRHSHFFCAEDGKCIPFAKLCNGVQDCPNSTDEVKHICADMIGVYSYLQNVVNHGQNKTISTVQNDSAVCEIAVPQGCECMRGGTTACSNTHWSSIPWHEFDNDTEKISLNNSLAENGKYGWENDTVVHKPRLYTILVENHRQKTGFPWEFLRQNQGIAYLYLENNGLEAIPSRIFIGFTSLKWLHVNKNELTYIDNETIAHLPNLVILDLSHNKLTCVDYVFRDVPLLFDVNLSYNRITAIGSTAFKETPSLKFLELNGNLIESIDKDAFEHMPRLEFLHLQENKIATLDAFLFSGLTKLTKLNLQHNPLLAIPRKLLCRLESLQSLNLTGYDIGIIETSVFKCFKNLTYVHFKKFSYCRFVPKVPFCYPSSDGLSDRQNLLLSPLRHFVWIMAVLAIAGNITVLVSRWGSRRKRGILDVFVNNLAVADMLTGIYLITLASKDIELREIFKENAHAWSTSWLCAAIGVITMISCEVSLLILTIMSLERYLVISGPFSAPKLSKTLAWVSMTIIWVFITLLALAPLLEWPDSDTFYGSSGLCFPLHLDDPFSTGWEFSAFVFIGLNSLCLILIAVSYGKLFYVIRQTRMSTPIFIRDMEMAFRFFLMVVTDFICWLPIIAFKVAVLYGYDISQDLHAWFLIIVLPLNSAVNPFLYTFSTGTVRSKFVQRMLKMISRVNLSDRNTFENHTFRHVGHTSDTPMCNSTLINKRQDGAHICSLTHQDSVTSK